MGRILAMLGLSPYALAGVLALIVAALGYNWWENNQIRDEERKVVEAEAMQRTVEAINEVSNAAEKARAMRRYCQSVGKLYDFGSNQCRG